MGVYTFKERVILPGRPLTAYLSAWGPTQQPTTVVGTVGTGCYGNILKVDVAGRFVGMRWGHHSNVTDFGAVGMVFDTSSPRNLLAVCRFRPNTAAGGTSVLWVNAWMHPWFRPTVGHQYQFVLHPLFVGLSYTDAALLSADLVSGHFTYPKDTASVHNGATNTGATIYPTTAANGKRWALDPLFLPD